jgi:hypothetical protein
MSNSETIESEIRAEFLWYSELSKKLWTFKQPTSRRFEERTSEKEVQFNDEK